MTDAKVDRLSEKVSLIGEKVATMQERIENLDDKVTCLDEKMSSSNNKLMEIHTVVTKNSVSQGWTRKLVMLMLTVVIGTVVAMGIKSIASDDSYVVHAAQEQVIQEDGSATK